MSQLILRRLRDLPSFELVPGDPDVRGWTLRGGDGQPLGTVDELLADPVAQQVRFLHVVLAERLPGVPAPGPHNENRILLPLSAVHFDNEGQNVFVTALTRDNIQHYPLFVEFQLPPGLEEAMHRALVG